MKPPNDLNILICSFHKNSGVEEIKQILLELFPGSRVEFAFEFFKIYPRLKYFDHIILCRRNVLSLTNNQTEINKYIEEFNCWSLFASLIVSFEESYERKWSLVYNLIDSLDNIYEMDSNNNKLTGFLNSNYNADLYITRNSSFCFP